MGLLEVSVYLHGRNRSSIGWDVVEVPVAKTTLHSLLSIPRESWCECVGRLLWIWVTGRIPTSYLCSPVTAPRFLLHASSSVGAISEASMSEMRCICRDVGGRNGLEAKGIGEALLFALCLLWWHTPTEGGHVSSLSSLNRKVCLLPDMAHKVCPHESLRLSPAQPGSWDCLLEAEGSSNSYFPVYPSGPVLHYGSDHPDPLYAQPTLLMSCILGFLKVCFIGNPSLFPGITVDYVSLYLYLIISVVFQKLEAHMGTRCLRSRIFFSF